MMLSTNQDRMTKKIEKDRPLPKPDKSPDQPKPADR